ncbi:OsmC family protein [Catenovulum sp. SM1970]|uniref:OsmC family protein n=1 Tax=Marinifaba aquimaris TaxID=2741323 RepID=UPI001572DDA2|nr:OsmC family protein [Marinifaba aquimaris]NTS77799.1 OsmC family protein [Marinifaba aquimaris]
MSIQNHKVTWQKERQFLATSDSGHEVLLDGRGAADGPRQAASPMEVVALGLGGCSSVDVVSILEKKKLAVSGCEVLVKTVRAESVPAVFTHIHLHFVITGKDIPEKAVERAVSLSADKYCSVSKMLEAGKVEITHDFEIVEG